MGSYRSERSHIDHSGRVRRLPILAFLFACAVALPANAQVTPATTSDTITFAATTGCSATLAGVNLQIPNDTNVMGFRFEIVFPKDTFAVDTSGVTESTLLTTGAGGSETYVFILEGESLSQGRLGVVGVRMQSNAANKGLSNALYGLLSNLKFRKLNADTAFAGNTSSGATNRDTIYVTNFVFRDKNNDTVSTSRTQISLRLFLLLLRRGQDFNGDGSSDGGDLTAILRVLRGIDTLGTYLDYGSPGDASNAYDSRTPDYSITGEDLTIFLRYLRGIES